MDHSFHEPTHGHVNVEEVSNLPELRQVFPQELAETVDFPFVCWKYDLPMGLHVLNERATVLTFTNCKIANVHVQTCRVSSKMNPIILLQS